MARHREGVAASRLDDAVPGWLFGAVVEPGELAGTAGRAGGQRRRVGQACPGSQGREAGDNGSDNPLFEALRRLRKRLADEAGMPPYIIFNDASLLDMAQRQPKTLEEFSTIFGVGQAKLARYGEPFVELIRQQSQG